MEDTILLELRNFKIFGQFVVKENSARIIYYFAFFCTTNFDVCCDIGLKMKRFLRTFWTSNLGTSTHIFSKSLQVVTKYKTRHEKNTHGTNLTRFHVIFTQNPTKLKMLPRTKKRRQENEGETVSFCCCIGGKQHFA